MRKIKSREKKANKVVVTPKIIAPVDIVQKSNPLIKDIEQLSKKWHKRWPKIEQPWPEEGTFNPDVIATLRVLISTYKAHQTKGKKGEKRQNKRQTELGVLKLFDTESQKRIKAMKMRDDKAIEIIQDNAKKVEKIMAEINVPFSHTKSIKKPPPYMKEVKIADVYPQLPVISHEGNYQIQDDNDRTIETGQAETTIRMYPSTKMKRREIQLGTEGTLRFSKMSLGDDDEREQKKCDRGGYHPTVRRLLSQAEKRGQEDEGSSSESNEDSDDEDNDARRYESSRGCYPAASSTGWKEEKRRAVREIDRSIDQCLSYIETAVTPEGRREMEDQVEELQKQRDRLQRQSSPKFDMTLRTRKEKKMLPVIVRGQTLEYKPWANTDMSNIIEKLPTLQDGAHSWTAKLDEIMVGTHFAMGDIKRLLATLLGIPAMEEILQRAGLNQYVGTAVNDAELLAANRARMWRALKDAFPTNVHPDNILIEPLGPEENPRAYVTRAHQVWRNVTGNDPEGSQMEQAILRGKIQKGLPLSVRSKLAEVVGLGSMTKGVYTDHIAHQVDLFRKKEQEQRVQDQEVLRKLNQVRLVAA